MIVHVHSFCMALPFIIMDGHSLSSKDCCEYLLEKVNKHNAVAIHSITGGIHDQRFICMSSRR